MVNRDSQVIPTGAERADSEQQRADEADAKARRLAERLRSMGVDPDQL
jgi:hypothetical protein